MVGPYLPRAATTTLSAAAHSTMTTNRRSGSILRLSYARAGSHRARPGREEASRWMSSSSLRESRESPTGRRFGNYTEGCRRLAVGMHPNNRMTGTASEHGAIPSPVTPELATAPQATVQPQHPHRLPRIDSGAGSDGERMSRTDLPPFCSRQCDPQARVFWADADVLIAESHRALARGLP